MESKAGDEGEVPVCSEAPGGGGQSRKERRKALKKQKRKLVRREIAVREREEEEEEALANDPEEQLRLRLRDQEEAEAAERERKEYEERERLWLEAAARRAEEAQKDEEARTRRLLEDAHKDEQVRETDEFGDGDDWEYVEEGPAEIIWKGNEIIVKKKRVRVKKEAGKGLIQEAHDRPTSNPLPPQHLAFEEFKGLAHSSTQGVLEDVAQQVPNFGTEQDKAHCPFHLKTGACRFGTRCSRVHFYPDKSSTLLIKNMYNGPGFAWEQDEGLEYTEEEVEHCYEEFYEDVHTEFLKFGELVNFKTCRNGSFHLRGNVYIHYRNLEPAILAHSMMNGRYYAGKQITCEFVNITRWKMAICGEFMKSRLKTCSHGTACNFIHCFRNPGGDYEWADWDNPPPRYWIKKMAVLFGPSDGSRKDMDVESEHQLPKDSSKKRMRKSERYQSRRDRYEETATFESSEGEVSDGNRDNRRGRRRGDRYSGHKRSSSSRERTCHRFTDESEILYGGHFTGHGWHEHGRCSYHSDDGMPCDRVSHTERESKEGSCIEDEEHVRKRSSRSIGTTAVDGERRSERRSNHRRRMPHSYNSVDGSRRDDEDGVQKDCSAGSKATSYKHASDDDERSSSRPPISGHLHSDREERSYKFKHRSRRHKHHDKNDGETGSRGQAGTGGNSSPVGASDVWMRDSPESQRRDERHASRGRSRSPFPSEAAEPRSSGISDDNSHEREKKKSKRSTTDRGRHPKRREHDAS